jgi:cell division protease FtsH
VLLLAGMALIGPLFATRAGAATDDAVTRPGGTEQSADSGRRVTLAGTLAQSAADDAPDKVDVEYALITEKGKRYRVDFSSPNSKLEGESISGKPTAGKLQNLNGAQVEVTGMLDKKTLTALRTRVIDHNPVPTAGPPTASLWDEIKAFLLTWTPIIFLFLLVVLIFWGIRMMPRTKPDRIKPHSSSSIRWDDVAGCEEAKHELREVVEFLREPDRFKRLGASVPKGILLHGPPGTGKTLLAKAVANESGANFFSQSASSFVEMFAGLGAARIRRLFAVARKHSPAILFIDELDAIGLKRGFDISREKDQTLNQLLVEMDGFEERGDLIVIAASNRVDGLDPALMRPGRFDRQVLVSPPDLSGRLQILGVHTRGKPVQNVDLKSVAQQTSGLTGADLANICNEAAIFAGRTGGDTILQKDFDAALERVVAGLQTRRVITAEEKRTIAYHEAGHALVGELLRAHVRIHRISIVPRGQALGYVLNLPEEDRYLMSKEDLQNHLKGLLGGYAAEKLVFNRTTTGAADDLKRVVEISRSMIEDYGMGSQLIAHDNGGKDSLSESARETRDREQQALIDDALFEARVLLTEYRGVLDAIASKLLEKETLDRKEIEQIIDGALHRSGMSYPGGKTVPFEREATPPRARTGRFDRPAATASGEDAGETPAPKAADVRASEGPPQEGPDFA